jgi:NAD(P)-dependent dehydrogenase (short-subunit alcohol dehydrogenase family)
MNVLVTGATGFIGRHLLERLTPEKGRVRALALPGEDTSGLDHLGVEIVQSRPQYNRSSYHTFSGFVAAAGPSIRASGDLGAVSPLDFAPVFLSLMGEPFSRRLAKRFMTQFIHHPSLNSRATTMAE